MKTYRSKYPQLPGSSLQELVRLARREYHIIQKKTPRRIPYVKSKYFIKDKVFISSFWQHLNQKSAQDRVRRLKLYSCGIDLLLNTTITPQSVYTNVDRNIGLHRFYGRSKDGVYFCVQVKENKRTNRKDYISVFPANKPS